MIKGENYMFSFLMTDKTVKSLYWTLYLENRILKIQKKISAVNCEAIYCEYRHPRSVTMGGSSGKAVEEAMGTDKKCVETGKLSKKYPPEA